MVSSRSAPDSIAVVAIIGAWLLGLWYLWFGDVTPRCVPKRDIVMVECRPHFCGSHLSPQNEEVFDCYPAKACP